MTEIYDGYSCIFVLTYFSSFLSFLRICILCFCLFFYLLDFQSISSFSLSCDRMLRHVIMEQPVLCNRYSIRYMSPCLVLSCLILS
jgi:hypothetical protein